MQIKFNGLWIEGFRSIVDRQWFNLDQPGLNMIKGTNGKGKTTLFEALVWCLYGANLKGTVNAKVQSWKEVRGNDYHGAKVSVTVFVDNVPYSIERNEPGKLIVTVDGEVLDELDKKDTQAYIDTLLTMDFNTFMNSFMFGQRMTRLVEAKSADKRKLFEELFSMDWIQKMRDRAAIDQKENEQEVVEWDRKLDKNNVSIEFLEAAVTEAKGRLEETVRNEANFKEDIERDIYEHEEEKAKYEKDKKALEVELADIPNPIEVEDFTDEIIIKEAELSSVESEVSRLTGELNTLQGKLEADQDRLESFDSINYDTYLVNVAKVEGEMKDIVSQMYPDDATSLLTDQEQMEIQHDYEEALENYNAQRNKLSELQQSYDEEGDDVCPTCHRPFDDAEEKAAHKQQLLAQIEVAKEKLVALKTILDAARVDATNLATYQRLETQLTTLNENAPDDPEQAKSVLQSRINTHEHDLGAIEDKLVVEKDKVKVLLDALDALDVKQNAGQDQRNENNLWAETKTSLTSKIAGTSVAIDQVNNQISRLKAELEQTQVPKLQEELDGKQNKLELEQQNKLNLEAELKKAQDELDVINFWLKDVFAANGLKAYIFKAMLDQLNQYTAKYGAKLGCSMRFSLDLTKVSAPFSTICTLGDKVNKEYAEFSGGEKQRLDIVLMFAMHDLLSSSTDINVLIMDEVFEGLDEQGESDVFELIREKAEGRSVFVISHSQVLDTLHSHTIEINNDNGRTILP